MTALPNIVLVHGAWADGSSWSAVIEHLQADGYRVTAPQFALTRLADDVARLRQVLARHLGEVMGVPAWKSLPTWFLIADGDQVIPPDAQRQFAPRMGATTVEVSTNHVAMVSHPDEVPQLIRTAVEAASR
jgi:pimeloyl-ACP methyl ester carboxylesterase